MDRKFFISLFILFFIFVGFVFAQKEQIRVSPKAFVMQVVGLTEVKIDYSRPGVKKRTIWGELVPYDKVWRTGANEATTMSFASDVLIEGKKLPAGKYSFFAIPTKDEWTLIFNKVADQWGAFEYNEAEDALRISVKPQSNGFQEWLTYSFTKTGDKSAIVNLEWEKLKVPFKVEVQ
ncbi:MAG: hypothetical protein A2V93_07810 [Ignavibacteria bacterium RBG_16_34_14]|nr:MAG: hypothetical protein A2V93_07810 [Ignavibacteria bacterium RBG_16_34_14]